MLQSHATQEVKSFLHDCKNIAEWIGQDMLASSRVIYRSLGLKTIAYYGVLLIATVWVNAYAIAICKDLAGYDPSNWVVDHFYSVGSWGIFCGILIFLSGFTLCGSIVKGYAFALTTAMSVVLLTWVV